jgi:hypothetical protein
MNNKTSVFVSYAAISMVGFGGAALLGFTGKASDTNAVVAFLGFYSFFCVTGAFYVIGKQKAAIEALAEHINDVNDSHWTNSNQINQRIDSVHETVERDSEERVRAVWAAIDRLDETVDEYRSAVSCGKSK